MKIIVKIIILLLIYANLAKSQEIENYQDTPDENQQTNPDNHLKDYKKSWADGIYFSLGGNSTSIKYHDNSYFENESFSIPSFSLGYSLGKYFAIEANFNNFKTDNNNISKSQGEYIYSYTYCSSSYCSSSSWFYPDYEDYTTDEFEINKSYESSLFQANIVGIFKYPVFNNKLEPFLELGISFNEYEETYNKQYTAILHTGKNSSKGSFSEWNDEATVSYNAYIVGLGINWNWTQNSSLGIKYSSIFSNSKIQYNYNATLLTDIVDSNMVYDSDKTTYEDKINHTSSIYITYRIYLFASIRQFSYHNEPQYDTKTLLESLQEDEKSENDKNDDDEESTSSFNF